MRRYRGAFGVYFLHADCITTASMPRKVPPDAACGIGIGSNYRTDDFGSTSEEPTKKQK